MIEIESSLFERLRDLIYRHSGMYFDEKKMYFFGRRVEARIEAVGATSVTDYYQMLRYGNGTDELQALCESLTTNETYFSESTRSSSRLLKTFFPEFWRHGARLAGDVCGSGQLAARRAKSRTPSPSSCGR